MSRLSTHARFGRKLWFTGHLKRTKDGRFICALHPDVRLVHPRPSSWICPVCYESYEQKLGRKTITLWRRRLPKPRRTFPMHRTRPAREET